MSISGLMGANVVYTYLRKDPDFMPYMKIMGYAMPLELPPQHHGDATWEQLAGMVEDLSDSL